MVLGYVVGAIVGLNLGNQVAKRIMVPKLPPPKTYDYIDALADGKEEFREEWNTEAKDAEVKRVLARTPYWCTFPDYERMLWLNNFIELIWKRNGAATFKTVQQVLTDGMPEWSKLTEEATKGLVHLEDIQLEVFDLGDSPLRVAGLKRYSTSQDEVIVDMPVQWGSQVDIRASVRVRMGPVELYLPVQIKNIQMTGCTRITLRPLVEIIPVLGAVNITLLEEPIVDAEIYIADGVDIMVLPAMKLALQAIIKLALSKMFVYPNSQTYDILPNAGLPPPMAGMLKVHIKGAEKLPNRLTDTIDPYVEVEVRKGRSLKTEVVNNSINPMFDSLFRFVIDDPVTQRVRLLVKDSDWLSDSVVGYAEIPIKGAPFFNEPRTSFHYKVGLKIVPPKKAQQFDVANIDEAAQKAEDERVNGAKTLAEIMDEEASEKSAANTVKGFRERMRNQLHISKDGGKEEDSEEAAALARAKAMRTIVVPGKHDIGNVLLDITYFPFEQPPAPTLEAAGRKRAQLATIARVNPQDRGVVTATLMACYNLTDGVDPYVKITLTDTHQSRVEMVKSVTKFNESQPRWDMKFDFVDITAGSKLLLVVYDRGTSKVLPSFIGKAVGAASKLLLHTEARKLGWLEIPMEDVAKNGSVKDRFNLRDAVRGEIEIKLEWYQVKRDAADVADEEARAEKRRAAFNAEYEALEAEVSARNSAQRPLQKMRVAKEAKEAKEAREATISENQ